MKKTFSTSQDKPLIFKEFSVDSMSENMFTTSTFANRNFELWNEKTNNFENS